MHLSIIIVSWNVKELLERLLDSILHYTSGFDYEIIVIDNASTDATSELIKTKFQKELQNAKIVLIENMFNNGFGKANNQGLRIAKGKYVAFLNPDMEMLENSFAKMIKVFESSPNIGLLTGRLLYGDKTVQPNVKNFPNFCSQLIILLKLHHFLFFLPCLKKYFNASFNYSQFNYCEQIMGACVFSTKAIMESVGAWDEDYFLWFEDVDLCRKIKDKGYDIVFTPTTEIMHFEGKSFIQSRGAAKQKRFNKGLLTYFKKHEPKWQYCLLSIFSFLSIALSHLTKLFKIKPRTQSKFGL
jgi:GT2 family glycosyltransferase